MELLMNTQKECQQLEVYGEYLKKIPELLKQLETVEKMYQKAVLEEAMLKDKPLDNHSVQLWYFLQIFPVYFQLLTFFLSVHK